MTEKLPVDAPLRRVTKAFEQIGFRIVREGNHIAFERTNDDGTKTPMTLPNHRTIKSFTLAAALAQSHVSKEEFLAVYKQT